MPLFSAIIEDNAVMINGLYILSLDDPTDASLYTGIYKHVNGSDVKPRASAVLLKQVSMTMIQKNSVQSPYIRQAVQHNLLN